MTEPDGSHLGVPLNILQKIMVSAVIKSRELRCKSLLRQAIESGKVKGLLHD